MVVQPPPTGSPRRGAAGLVKPIAETEGVCSPRSASPTARKEAVDALFDNGRRGRIDGLSIR